MLKEEKKIVSILKRSRLKRSEKNHSGILGGWHRYSIKNIDYDKCRLFLYVFNYLLECPAIHTPMEKINWEVSFIHKDTRCTISHEKLGFHIYIDRNIKQEDANKSYQELFKILDKLINELSPILKIYAQQALSKNKIIVDNKFNQILSAYQYFRTESTKDKQYPEDASIIHDLENSEPDTLDTLDDEDWRSYARLLTRKPPKYYYEEAAYFTYISLIEHLAVLFFAFNHQNNMGFVEFTQKSWSEKFKIVFPIQEQEFKTFYDKLLAISNYKRNPHAHGFVTNRYTNVSFYFSKAAHRIPISLYDDKVILELSRTEANLALLDNFLETLENHKETRNIMYYIKADFDISFLQNTKLKYREIKSMDDKTLKKYIRDEERKQEAGWNMDWWLMY